MLVTSHTSPLHTFQKLTEVKQHLLFVFTRFIEAYTDKAPRFTRTLRRSMA